MKVTKQVEKQTSNNVLLFGNGSTSLHLEKIVIFLTLSTAHSLSSTTRGGFIEKVISPWYSAYNKQTQASKNA